jgi:hypothetical protein
MRAVVARCVHLPQEWSLSTCCMDASCSHLKITTLSESIACTLSRLDTIVTQLHGADPSETALLPQVISSDRTNHALSCVN